ncbi:hypothetical protein [Halomonas alkalicola]|uniref:hypothetical protein n=1 Tax=Halomonas alkalicola TaxID=1930622 RepID=UPI00265F05CC|nr:hypothetical protein [Halomonas alkalicola]
MTIDTLILAHPSPPTLALPYPLALSRAGISVCDVNYFGRLATIRMAGWVG